MHYVKANGDGGQWHIYHYDPASTDSDTHTLCGDHWFYGRTDSQIERPPLGELCTSCYDFALPGVEGFAKMVEEELIKARDGHPPIHSLHEGYSVVLEELDEVWAEIKKKRAERDPVKVLIELVQVAAMCQRTAEDMDLA